MMGMSAATIAVLGCAYCSLLALPCGWEAEGGWDYGVTGVGVGVGVGVGIMELLLDQI